MLTRGQGAGMSNLILDTHHYEVFDSSTLEMSTQDHISTACQFGDQMASTNKLTIAGEVSKLLGIIPTETFETCADHTQQF